ncbi:hypothetical protein ILYODFUR_010577 [Ilyodon furcidens]|uniref:Uncharacterized protein n=1 Tax=Ilyodon furcidens TaxID=33524 RepID=A0ABV0TXQ4_9TELE
MLHMTEEDTEAGLDMNNTNQSLKGIVWILILIYPLLEGFKQLASYLYDNALCMNECVHGCLCVALRWTGDLSRVYPASRP